jgi:hypothetical protein
MFVYIYAVCNVKIISVWSQIGCNNTRDGLGDTACVSTQPAISATKWIGSCDCCYPGALFYRSRQDQSYYLRSGVTFYCECNELRRFSFGVGVCSGTRTRTRTNLKIGTNPVTCISFIIRDNSWRQHFNTSDLFLCCYTKCWKVCHQSSSTYIES